MSPPIGIARGAWAPPGWRKKLGAKFPGESSKCTPRQSNATVQLFQEIGEICTMERLF